MRSGIWQFGERRAGNDGISCQSVAGPMKSLCRGENAPMGFRHPAFSRSFPFPSSSSLPPFLSLYLFSSRNTPFHLLAPRSHALSPRFDVVPPGVEEGIISGNLTGIRGNNARPRDTRSDTFEHRARPRRVEESVSKLDRDA